MNKKTSVTDYYSKLKDAETDLKKLGFNTLFIDVDTDIPFPLLQIGLENIFDDSDSEINVTLMITPYDETESPDTYFIQLLHSFDITVNEDNFEDIAILSNLINSFIFVGFFSVSSDISFRYTCPIPSNLPVTNKSFMEIFSIWSSFLIRFHKVMSDVATKKITLNEGIDLVQSFIAE